MFTLTEYLLVFFSLLTIICVRKLLAIEPPPIFNVYRQPGQFYWLKVAFIYLSMKLRAKPKYNDPSSIDCPQPLADGEQPIDGVYFNGANASGDALIVGMARRRPPLIDGFLYLRLPAYKGGVLHTPRLPSTALTQNAEEIAAGGHCAEGVSLTPLEPMRRWAIVYHGSMIDSTTGASHNVTIDATWSSAKPVFNFDLHMDDLLMAKAVAHEAWSRDYFKTLKDVHQTHYEQPGEISGTATIDGVPYALDLQGVRDHSFGGHRDWRYFHRYMLHFCTLENGDQMNVGVISMPLVFSTMYMGFYYKAATNKVYAVQSCDLRLYQHGENGTPPVDYAFRFVAGNEAYMMEVDVIESSDFFISADCAAHLYESYSRFKVNGVKGHGHVEFQYRNGRMDAAKG